jgi:hypothetical protein
VYNFIYEAQAMNEKLSTQIEKKYCNTCRINTFHDLAFTHERENASDEFIKDPLGNFGEIQQFTYGLWICRGCGTPLLHEIMTSYIGQDEFQEETDYPKRTKHAWQKKTFLQLSDKLSNIYTEVIDTYNIDAKILTAIGLRMLIEGICVDKGIEGNTLYQKIENLTIILPNNIVESLHKFRFIGNEATHELQIPTELELRRAIEVIEDLLNFLYELDYKARVFFNGEQLPSNASIHPSSKVIKVLIERQPSIPKGQIELYKFLYLALPEGLSLSDLAQKMDRTEQQIYGVLGALGRRVNNTDGIKGNPGVNYVLEFVKNINSGEDQTWGWKMRPELRKVLEAEKYSWAKNWLK